MALSGEYIPRDYEDLYKAYMRGPGSLAGTLVRKFTPGDKQEVREELVHDVFLRLMEKDMLRVFDRAKANFGGVIYFVTRTVCINYLKHRMRDPLGARRGPTIVEEQDLENREVGEVALDKIVLDETTPERAVGSREQVERLRARLTNTFRGKRQEFRRVGMVAVLECLGRGDSIEEISEELGVTGSTVRNWVGLLRELLEECSG